MALIPDDVHNYYEDLLQQHIQALELHHTRDEEYLADLCCLVLNQLPAHYIRHNVDMCYFTSPAQRDEMELRVQDAVGKSVNWLDKKEHQRKTLEEN
jgi:hypothetical protein